MTRHILIGLSLTFSSYAAFAAPAGQVVQLSGAVSGILPSGETVKLSPNANIEQGMEIQTGKDGLVELRLIDRSVVKVGPLSKMKVDIPSDAPEKVTLQLADGRIRALVKKRIDGKRSFHVKTPTATMGVRGTQFLVTVAGAGENRKSDCYVLSGSVQVDDAKGRSLALLQPGSFLSVQGLLRRGGGVELPARPPIPYAIPKAVLSTLSTDSALTAKVSLPSADLPPPPADRGGDDSSRPKQPPAGAPAPGGGSRDNDSGSAPGGSAPREGGGNAPAPISAPAPGGSAPREGGGNAPVPQPISAPAMPAAPMPMAPKEGYQQPAPVATLPPAVPVMQLPGSNQQPGGSLPHKGDDRRDNEKRDDHRKD